MVSLSVLTLQYLGDKGWGWYLFSHSPFMFLWGGLGTRRTVGGSHTHKYHCRTWLALRRALLGLSKGNLPEVFRKSFSKDITWKFEFCGRRAESFLAEGVAYLRESVWVS